MKICILGGEGRLGYDLTSAWQERKIISLKREDLDITDAKQVEAVLMEHSPQVIIHAAGYTDVDSCEKNIEMAERVNVLGTKNIVSMARKLDSTLVYISSSYVFDGTKMQGYDEIDIPCPINIYGKTKHKGEVLVQEGMEKYFIVRTGWLFGHWGNNFIKTTLNLAGERAILKVVNDQWGCPTYTIDLSKALEQLFHIQDYGIYHLVNKGSGTWYEFAQEILNLQGVKAKLEPISALDLNQRASRPQYGILNNNTTIQLPSWQKALQEYMKKEESRI